MRSWLSEVAVVDLYPVYLCLCLGPDLVQAGDIFMKIIMETLL
jgi:hypothetical protein